MVRREICPSTKLWQVFTHIESLHSPGLDEVYLVTSYCWIKKFLFLLLFVFVVMVVVLGIPRTLQLPTVATCHVTIKSQRWESQACETPSLSTQVKGSGSVYTWHQARLLHPWGCLFWKFVIWNIWGTSPKVSGWRGTIYGFPERKRVHVHLDFLWQVTLKCCPSSKPWTTVLSRVPQACSVISHYVRWKTFIKIFYLYVHCVCVYACVYVCMCVCTHASTLMP